MVALWLAARDEHVPLSAKLLALVAAGYALSPIDLIPDFVPLLGYLDDLILVPLGIALAIRLIPGPVLARLRREADAYGRRPVSYAAAALFLCVWIGISLWISWLLLVHD